MNSRLYVGNLSDSTDESRLRATFEAFGDVVELRIVSDGESGQSRGFGFVEFASVEVAQRATRALHGKKLDGRSLNVKMTRLFLRDEPHPTPTKARKGRPRK